jgi:protein CrcB
MHIKRLKWVLLGVWLYAWGAFSFAQDTSAESASPQLTAGVTPPVAHPAPTPWERTALVGTALMTVMGSVTGHITPAILAVAAGGALGSVGRYLVSHSVTGWLEGDYPYGTLVVNVVGSFVFGTVSGWAALRSGDIPDTAWLDLVTTGFLGGFTTFSLFAHDTVGLAHTQGIAGASVYTMLSVGMSVAALLAGEFVGSGGVLP